MRIEKSRKPVRIKGWKWLEPTPAGARNMVGPLLVPNGFKLPDWTTLRILAQKGCIWKGANDEMGVLIRTPEAKGQSTDFFSLEIPRNFNGTIEGVYEENDRFLVRGMGDGFTQWINEAVPIEDITEFPSILLVGKEEKPLNCELAKPLGIWSGGRNLYGLWGDENGEVAGFSRLFQVSELKETRASKIDFMEAREQHIARLIQRNFLEKRRRGFASPIEGEKYNPSSNLVDGREAQRVPIGWWTKKGGWNIWGVLNVYSTKGNDEQMVGINGKVPENFSGDGTIYTYKDQAVLEAMMRLKDGEVFINSEKSKVIPWQNLIIPDIRFNWGEELPTYVKEGEGIAGVLWANHRLYALWSNKEGKKLGFEPIANMLELEGDYLLNTGRIRLGIKGYLKEIKEVEKIFREYSKAQYHL